MDREPRGRSGEPLLSPKLVGVILLLAGVGLFVLAGVIAHRQRNMFAGTLRTTGTVVAMFPRHSGGSTSYAPLVRYRTPNGLELDFTSGSASSRPRYQVGQTVPVVYPALNPSQAEIDSWLMRWGETTIVGGFALVFVVGGGILFVTHRR